ncbi:MAG: hypothetical protein KC478_17315, partial [Bacteriovoracaceae bacterium]|nr:hypothetical protein [Bacteriovoracaceae bacterium]
MSLKKNKKANTKSTPKKEVNSKDKPAKVSKAKNADIKGIIRPLVIGDEHMAFRLHVHFLSDSIFEYFDPTSILEKSYDPNLVILIGPLNTKVFKEVESTLSENQEFKLIYACSVLGEEEAQRAGEQAQRLNADAVITKEFVTVEDIKEQ